MNDNKVNDTMRLVFEQSLGRQATEALEMALQECGVTPTFRLEVGDWHLDAEIVWHTDRESPRREVWKGWACFRVHTEKGLERVVPLLLMVNEGEVTFPNLAQVAQAIL